MANVFTSTDNPQHKTILFIISGGVSAYKVLDLIRTFKKDGVYCPAILTKGAQEFITPLSVSALSGAPVYTDLFSLKDEQEMGHIRLSREADLIVIVPASANMIARTAHGMADDLASAVLLAADKPVICCPAMNPQMWTNAATQENIATLSRRGIDIIQPDHGEVACGETGQGRLPSVEALYKTINKSLNLTQHKPLSGYKALVTAGPTYEKIDPVRFIGNRSSGKQGYAIAAALAQYGADVTLISGPTALPCPQNVKRVELESATDMLSAVEQNLPCDIAVFTAAVCDWRVSDVSENKLKKRDDHTPPHITFSENPDILKTIATHKAKRPRLVIGFAAETDNIQEHAQEKLIRKGCDMLIANQVGHDKCTFGNDHNDVYFLTPDTDSENWGYKPKHEIADMLVCKVIENLEKHEAINHTGANITKLEA